MIEGWSKKSLLRETKDGARMESLQTMTETQKTEETTRKEARGKTKEKKLEEETATEICLEESVNSSACHSVRGYCPRNEQKCVGSDSIALWE